MLLLHQIVFYDLDAKFRKNIKLFIYLFIYLFIFIILQKTIDNKIRDKKLQYDINREVAKILALSSNEFDKNEHLQVNKRFLLIKAK